MVVRPGRSIDRGDDRQTRVRRSPASRESSSCPGLVPVAINTSTSSGVATASDRSSSQSVRWSRWPTDTAVTGSPGDGAGK